MVYAVFRDAQRDIPDPPLAQSAPGQHRDDGENMDARPDEEKIEQAIKKILQPSNRRRASRTWPPYRHSCPSVHKGRLAPCLWLKLWRLVFSQHWTKIRPICSLRRSCACTDTLRTTGF